MSAPSSHAPGSGATQDGARTAPSDVTATAARQGALGLIGAISAGAGGLALTITVGRLLPAHDAGIYFTAVALFTIATSILVLGTDTGLVRALSGLRAARRPDRLRPTLGYAVRPVLAATVITAALGVVLAGPVADRAFTHQTAEQMRTAIRLLAPFLIASTLSLVLLNGAARGLGSLRAFTTVQQVFLPAARPLLVAAAVLGAHAWHLEQRVGDGDDDGWAALTSPASVALLAWALPLLLALVIAVRAVRRLLPPPTLAAPEHPADPAHTAGAFWRSTAPRAVAATFEVLIVWSDVVLVTALIGATQAGIYAAASRFVTSGTFALQAVRLSVGPLLAAAFARDDRHEAEHVHRLSVRWAVLSTWPVYVAMAVFAPGVLAVLGPSFASAAPALTLLCLAMLGVVATGNANTVLNMAHHSHWAAANTGTAIVVMLSLDWVLVPRLGILGAAIGWSAAMLTDAIASFTEVRLGLGLHSVDGAVVRSMLTVLGAFALPALAVRITAHLLDGEPSSHVAFLTLLGGTALASVSYLAALAAQRRALGLDELVGALRRRRVTSPAPTAPTAPIAPGGPSA